MAENNERVTFTKSSADRIAAAVRSYEQGDRDGTPLSFKHVQTGGGRAPFRIGTFTGAWAKDATTVVTLFTITNTPNTLSVMNLFAEITTSSINVRKCAVARDGTAWYLIAAEC
jgi:hypothetical protein